MNIECFKNYNTPYLRLVASLGLKKVNGKTVHRRKNVLNLGPLSRHDDGKPDYLRRLRESFKAGKPLIKALEPYVGDTPKGRVTITFEKGDAKCHGEPKRMAATILDPVFNALGLDELFVSVKFSSKIGYDLTGIVRLLTYGRLLDPASKSATMSQNGRYYRPLVSSTNDDNVYDALDVIQRNAKQIVRRMNTCVTGNVLDGTKLAAMIDDEKLSAFNELFGYYQIVTSELDMTDREVIDMYHGLTQIEDQFREMKSTLETRPIYVRTREHIEAHLMICFIALTMMRLIQRKTKSTLGAEFGKDLDWTYGLPGARVAKAFADWQVNELPGEYYQMLNASGEDIGMLLKAFGLEVPAKIYTNGDIRGLKSAVNPF